METGVEISAIFIGPKASNLIADIKTGDVAQKGSYRPFERTLEGYLESSL